MTIYSVIPSKDGEEVSLKFSPGAGVRLLDVETDYIEMSADAARAVLRHVVSRIAAAVGVATDDPDEPRPDPMVKRLDRAMARLDQRKFAAETLADMLYHRNTPLEDHEARVVAGLAKSAEREIAFILRYTERHRRESDTRFVTELTA